MMKPSKMIHAWGISLVLATVGAASDDSSDPNVVDSTNAANASTVAAELRDATALPTDAS